MAVLSKATSKKTDTIIRKTARVVCQAQFVSGADSFASVPSDSDVVNVVGIASMNCRHLLRGEKVEMFSEMEM
jgi:hypothetical protein